jgi:alpha-methylacyl-CoA racemase
VKAGPLADLRVVEMAGIGPAPFAGMVLADFGADVIRIDRPGAVHPGWAIDRGRVSVELNLKSPAGLAALRPLICAADLLIEGFRPGVMEGFGFGPDDCRQFNPRLIYGRMTGWGQDGPLAARAGHDINYIAVAGALAHFGRHGQPPVFPENLVGDFGGGAMFLLVGLLAALHERERSGLGQVIDAAMVDGTAQLMTMPRDFLNGGGHSDERGDNMLDSGAPFYDVYETSDGRWLAIGTIEAPFFRNMVAGLGLVGFEATEYLDRQEWPRLREAISAAVRGRTMAEWTEVFDGVDACVGPVLTMTEAAEHPHMAARGTFVRTEHGLEHTPAPRFSRTPAEVSPRLTSDPDEARGLLARFGLDAAQTEALVGPVS